MLLLLLGLLVWVLGANNHARIRALRYAAMTCKNNNLMLLDNSVSLARMGLRYDHAGRLRVRRMYRFDYSDDGYARHPGYVILLGSVLESIHVEHAHNSDTPYRH